jgi:hypothetical protein
MFIEGRIEDMNLVYIVQILHAEKRTVGIHLSSERGFGSVYARDGELVHASYRDLSGIEALWNLFGWEDGDFEVVENESNTKQTISKPFEELMLEGMRNIEGESNKVHAIDIESLRLIKRLLELGILEKVA